MSLLTNVTVPTLSGEVVQIVSLLVDVETVMPKGSPISMVRFSVYNEPIASLHVPNDSPVLTFANNTLILTVFIHRESRCDPYPVQYLYEINGISWKFDLIDLNFELKRKWSRFLWSPLGAIDCLYRLSLRLCQPS